MQDVQTLIEKRCHLGRYGLTWPQYRPLLVTANGTASMLGELAEGINCTRGNLTGVANRLERAGWLVRQRNRGDGRVVTLRLTAKGERILTIHSELMTDLASLVNVWNAGERAVLASNLGRLATNSAPLAQAG